MEKLAQALYEEIMGTYDFPVPPFAWKDLGPSGHQAWIALIEWIQVRPPESYQTALSRLYRHNWNDPYAHFGPVLAPLPWNVICTSKNESDIAFREAWIDRVMRFQVPYPKKD